MRPLRVADDIESFPALTPTLPPATHTNSYALGSRDVLVVEPATPDPEEQRAWIAWVQGLASQGRRPVALFATHHHADHVGGAAFLAREVGLPLWAHRVTARLLADSDVAVARELEEGEDIVLAGPTPSSWRALHTPGHAPGHLCLWNAPRGVLLVGDMVASVGTILIAPGDGDMAEYLRQLERLATLPASLALPAHGAPIEDPTALFRRYVAHRLGRERRILDAVVTAPGATAEKLVSIAYADVGEEIWPIARLSLEAHLEKLEGEGRVRRTQDGFVASDSSAGG